MAREIQTRYCKMIWDRKENCIISLLHSRNRFPLLESCDAYAKVAMSEDCYCSIKWWLYLVWIILFGVGWWSCEQEISDETNCQNSSQCLVNLMHQIPNTLLLCCNSGSHWLLQGTHHIFFLSRQGPLIRQAHQPYCLSKI